MAVKFPLKIDHLRQRLLRLCPLGKHQMAFEMPLPPETDAGERYKESGHLSRFMGLRRVLIAKLNVL